MKTVIVTGSSGLIGSQSAKFFHDLGYRIIGIDNDMRSYFFGESGSTNQTKCSLIDDLDHYTHYNFDIRNYKDLESIFLDSNTSIELIVHAAAQPSHDWAAKEPLTDYTINAVGTLNLLELTRIYCPQATFIFTSTNKVYGDTPNLLPLIELDKRYEHNELATIDESMSIDQCKHSLFGVSKLSADLLCQEYGRYFGLRTGIFRCGCLTGPNHAGTEMHGFLSYLVKCMVHKKPYTIFGYKGKQVRDNLHSFDLVNMFLEFHKNPKCGEVYNAGGGRYNSCSVLEVIDLINNMSGTSWDLYSISKENRIGDHIWYISNISKFQNDFPKWKITKTLNITINEMISHELLS